MSSVVGLLDLPIGSCISLDGQPLVLQRDDFVGFCDVPTDGLHCMTVRATVHNKGRQTAGAGVTVAYFWLDNVQDVVKRYDAYIEEMSSNDVDTATTNNLLEAIRIAQIRPPRVIPYSQVVDADNLASWKQNTCFITDQLLRKWGIETWKKVVAGSYEQQADIAISTTATYTDGSPINYPPIPVLIPSMRHTKHTGTQRFLQGLSPQERTIFFTSDRPADLAFAACLSTHHNGDWKELLGGMQLSFFAFKYVQCYSSLQHWLNVLVMVSLVSASSAQEYGSMFVHLLTNLTRQVSTFDRDFFEDFDLSGDNAIVPALQRIRGICIGLSTHTSHAEEWRRFDETLQSVIGLSESTENPMSTIDRIDFMTSDEDESDEDGPVVVSCEEVEASQSRTTANQSVPSVHYPKEVRQRYPVLFAAMMPHEDILMTCARALDVASDVSLVREAADYLENVEKMQSTS
jgi:AAR2 protein